MFQIPCTVNLDEYVLPKYLLHKTLKAVPGRDCRQRYLKKNLKNLEDTARIGELEN